MSIRINGAALTGNCGDAAVIIACRRIAAVFGQCCARDCRFVIWSGAPFEECAT